MILLAVRDIKSESYLGMHVAVAAGAAVRQFGDAATSKDSFIAAHPEDYQLFKLADVDERTGLVTPCYPCVLLASATDFLPVKTGA